MHACINYLGEKKKHFILDVHHLFVFCQMNGNAHGKIFPDIIMNENEQINHISPLILNVLPLDQEKKMLYIFLLLGQLYLLPQIFTESKGNFSKAYKSPGSAVFWIPGRRHCAYAD